MKTKMCKKLTLVFLVALVALAFAPLMSAALSVGEVKVEVDGINVEAYDVAVITGSVVPVTVTFTALENADDVEISAWIQGERQDRVDRKFEDLIDGRTYKSRLSVTIPELSDDTEKDLTLYVRIESDSGTFEKAYTLKAQRQAHNLVVLLVDHDSTVRAGNVLPVSVILKNLGRHEAKDVLVNVKISELGISRTVYFDDLAVKDSCEDDKCEKSDSRERILYLTIPEGANAGTYNVEVTASTSDFKTVVNRPLKVETTPVNVAVLSNPTAKTFAVGEEAVYEIVLVNSGNQIAVFNLAPEASNIMSVSLSDSLVTVPAGSSKTVKVYAKANAEGTFGFAVNVIGENFAEKATFNATVEGRKFGATDNVVALTIVLAIIFVVLVVILVVLLTRKPEKSEEFGESYY